MTYIIIAINLFSLVSSLIFNCNKDNKFHICSSFIFQILCIHLNLTIFFKYWDEVKEGEILIRTITIVYFLYRFICSLASYNNFPKDRYEIAIVLTDYIILFPIAFSIYLIIGFILAFSEFVTSCFD